MEGDRWRLAYFIFDDNWCPLHDSWYHDEDYKAWNYLDESFKAIRGSKDKTFWKWSLD